MSETVILTDSVAQIPPDLAKQYGIGVIPFTIIINGQPYKDGIDIQAAELYQKMRVESVLPTTSQPSIGEYQEFFSQFFEQGAKNIVYVCLSEKLSGAYSTALEAAQETEKQHPGKKVVVTDSGTATIAQGFLAIEAAKACLAEQSLEHILALIERTKPKVGFFAMLDTLHYLSLGGRIGKAAYLVGNMINIKPLITIDPDGVVSPMGNLHGEKKIAEKLVKVLKETICDRQLAELAIMQGDDLKQANQLKRLVKSQVRFPIELVTEFTPVMGAHAGPGVLGFGYLFK